MTNSDWLTAANVMFNIETFTLKFCGFVVMDILKDSGGKKGGSGGNGGNGPGTNLSAKTDGKGDVIKKRGYFG